MKVDCAESCVSSWLYAMESLRQTRRVMWCCNAEQTTLVGYWWNWRRTALIMMMMMQIMFSTVIDAMAIPPQTRRTYSFPDTRQGRYHCLSVITGRICPKGSSAGISFTHGPILGFFAPQGRHVEPIKVKFGREEVRSSLPNLTLIGSGVGVYGPQN